MALQDVAVVNISLNTSALTREGFGTPAFLTRHRTHTDRVRTYTSLDGLLDDGYKTDGAPYVAATAVFSNSPNVKQFKVLKQRMPWRITPKASSLTGANSFTVIVTDEDGAGGTMSYTTGGASNATTVCSNLFADFSGTPLDSNGKISVTNEGTYLLVQSASVTGTDAADTVAPEFDFYIHGDANVDITPDTGIADTVESLVVALNACRAVDDDFYVLGCKDRDHTRVLNLCTAVEALDKLLVIGDDDVDSINNAYTGSGSTDLIGKITEGNYMRTITWWHQDADQTHNELEFVGYNLPFQAGSVVWSNLRVGVENAKNELDNKLTATQEENLNDRNCNWASIKGNIVYTRGGKVASGEWIDNIHGRDNLKSDLEADLFDLLTNQQGRKIPFTDKGIQQVKSVIESRLQYYRRVRNFLTDNILVTAPSVVDVPTNEKAQRLLTGITFSATLQGGIILVELTGTLEV